MTQTYDQFTDLLQARYSCRAFLSDPLPEETITQIVSAARRALMVQCAAMAGDRNARRGHRRLSRRTA